MGDIGGDGGRARAHDRPIGGNPFPPVFRFPTAPPAPAATPRSGGERQAPARPGPPRPPAPAVLAAPPCPLATARDGGALGRDLTELAAEAEAFRDRYQGRLAGLSGAELGAAVAAYERLQEKTGRVMSYASLVHAGDLADPEIGRFYQTMQEKTN